MTVSSTTTKNSYSGNGGTTVFAYAFKIFAEADLKVVIRSSTGTETTKTLNSDYTVSGVGVTSGGNVTFGTPPASGETVVIRREAALTQTTDYTANDPFPAEDHENALDKLTFHTQQQQEELDRAIKLSRTNTMTSTEFTVGASDRANKILAFDSSGEISVTQELGTFKGNWAASTAYVQRDIVKDTSTNNIFIVNAAHTSSGSQPLTTNANSAKYDLLVDAASATTSASAAATSATNAANSATAAANTLTTFQGQYHGAASSDPSSNLDAGDLYFNTSDGELKVYTGSAWVSTKPTASEQANINALGQSDVVADMALLATTDVIADMALLANADVIADMNTLATTDIVSDLNTLATSDIVSDLNTLATSDIVTDLNILATSDNVTNMATLGASGVVSNIATVAGVASNVTTVANNISGVNSFAERYRVASSDPSSNNDAGDLVYNTTDNNLKFFNGSSFVSVGGAISNLVEDTTPQLGGNLDVNGNSIVSVSGGNIAITPDGSGKVIIDGLSHPTSDGSAGQFLKTDGGGNLSFDTVSGTTINNNADNRVITGSGSANTLEGEANFTFDGSKVGIGASLTPSSALHVSGANNNVASEFRLTAEANQTFKLGANGANLFFTSDHSAPTMFFNRAGTGTAVGGTTMFSVDNNNIQIRTDNQGTTLNGTRGISKCWLTGNSNTPIDSHNTQGYVDHGTGQQTVQVNHNYANANYCISFGSKFSGTFAWLTLQNNPSAGAFRFTMGDRNGGVQEGSRMMAMTMGQSA